MRERGRKKAINQPENARLFPSVHLSCSFSGFFLHCRVLCMDPAERREFSVAEQLLAFLKSRADAFALFPFQKASKVGLVDQRTHAKEKSYPETFPKVRFTQILEQISLDWMADFPQNPPLAFCSSFPDFSKTSPRHAPTVILGQKCALHQ